MKTKNLERYLNSYGKEVINNSKNNLRSAGKGGGELESSLDFKVVRAGKGFIVQFYMADYGTFVDKGVKGAGGEIKSGKHEGKWGGRRYYTTWEGKRKDSPYQYGTGTGKKGGMRKGIGSFIRKKGLQPRSAGGQYMTTAGLSIAIMKVLWVKGIHGISFFQKALGLGSEDFAERVLEATSKDIAANMEEQNKKNK